MEDRLIDLHNRVHCGTYRVKPSRRVYIEADGRQRPLGVAALEDKIVQQAVATVLNEIYETDFIGFSMVLGRSATRMRRSTRCRGSRKKVNCILDADINGFFDHLITSGC